MNAMKKLGVDAQRCVGRRLNTAVRWATGISGAESKNPDIRDLLAKVSKITLHISHTPLLLSTPYVKIKSTRYLNNSYFQKTFLTAWNLLKQILVWKATQHGIVQIGVHQAYSEETQ